MIATKDWHKVLGELRSISITLPGSVGLYSLLQESFCHEDQIYLRLSLSKSLHGLVKDFRCLAKDAAARPTRIADLVPNACPAMVGSCDTAGLGMGGVHFVPTPEGAIKPGGNVFRPRTNGNWFRFRILMERLTIAI